MKSYVLILLMLVAGLTVAGALDINFDLKDLNNDISLEDLCWLTKSIDTGMIYSSVAFAGTIHFYIDKPLEGTLLTVGKWLGYGMFIVGTYLFEREFGPITSTSLIVGGLGLYLATAIYDISAGKDYLERKQAEIIYKYRQKPGI